ncbi:MAG: hypothetical protein RIC14_10010 [Filomicrobium sp.]
MYLLSRAFFALSIVASTLTVSSTDASADRRRSPVAGLQNLAPDTRPVAPRLKPVPELILRTKLEREGRNIPWAVSAYEERSNFVADLRRRNATTNSGLPQLSIYYRELHERLRRTPVATRGISELFKQYETWRSTSQYDPFLDVFIASRKEALLYQRLIWSQHETPDAKRHADEVPGLAMELFKYLKDHHSSASADPGWYYISIYSYVYRCNEWRDAWSLLKEGTKKFPSYYWLYFRAYDVGLRCGHDPVQLMDDLVELAVDRTRKEHGDSMYARLKWSQTAYYGGDLLRSRLVDWERMRKSMMRVLQDYPDAWNTNHFAYFTCIAGDDTLAEKLLPKAMTAPVNSVWANDDILSSCHSRIERAKFNKESKSRN